MTRRERLERQHKLLMTLANTAEAGGLAKEHSILLLWYLRNVVGIDDLDAYEFVCDGDLDEGVDGLYLEASTGDDDFETLVIYQSKYNQGPTQVGPTAIDRLVSTANRFRTSAGLAGLLAADIEPKLLALIRRFRLEQKLAEGRIDDGRLRVRLVLVTTGVLNGAATRAVEAQNEAEGAGYLTVQDLTRLGPRAEAFSNPSVPRRTIDVPCPASDRMVVGESPNRVAIAAVKASDVVAWPGVDDRTLFELNVRREIRSNRVRQQLDSAIRRTHDHVDFLAFHNGLTVTCAEFTEGRGKLTVRNPSVVNGCQSVVALAEAAQAGLLSDDLRIPVKFVEVKGRPQLAKEVSRRSNTQNPVNLRNLVSLSGPQQRLLDEFAREYPEITYETRPDASLGASGRVIKNDDAAQLLCAVYNAMPWLAVKRNTLFESDNHAMIFPESITAAHIVFADDLRKAVDADKDLFPAEYRKSWQLTRMVGVYLVAQMIKTATTPPLAGLLDRPADAVENWADYETAIGEAVAVAAATMVPRRAALTETPDSVDAYNVDFKNTEELQGLRDRARENFVLMATMEASRARRNS